MAEINLKIIKKNIIMEKEINGFVMYRSFLDASRNLSPDQFKEFILKLSDYAFTGAEEPSSNPVVNALLIMARPNVKAATTRYEQKKNKKSRREGDGKQ